MHIYVTLLVYNVAILRLVYSTSTKFEFFDWMRKSIQMSIDLINHHCYYCMGIGSIGSQPIDIILSSNVNNQNDAILFC